MHCHKRLPTSLSPGSTVGIVRTAKTLPIFQCMFQLVLVAVCLWSSVTCLVQLRRLNPVRRRSCCRSKLIGRGKPPLWDALWQVPMLQPGEAGSPIGFGDLMQGVKSGIEEQFMNESTYEGIPKGQRGRLQGDDMFEILRSFYDEYGPVYKTALGIASGISVADPVMIRHILTGRGVYDKGILGLISEDIFGQGLITATDKEVWTSRRKLVSPGFNRRWLEGLAGQFAKCTAGAIRAIDAAAAADEVVDLESVYLNLGLDIVGKAVFNFDFNSVAESSSPIVSAVYRVLKETGFRAENPFLLALAQVPKEYSSLVPEAKEYRDSLQRLDSVLDEVIDAAKKAGVEQMETDTLQKQAFSNDQDRSLLRFLIDVRGEDTSSSRLKDDLRTLLIAGHETVASIMTWATFELARNPEIFSKVRAELDAVLEGGRDPTFEDIEKLEYLRVVIAETLRLYPAPPVLMRRTLKPDVLPEGSEHGKCVPLKRGTLIILQIAMLHRSPALYDDPNVFRPERWLQPFGPSSKVSGWRGYDPARVAGLVPNEQSSDFAFVPFGGGEFKCVGDQFAVIEATVVLAKLIQRYNFTPVYSTLRDVGIDVAATIHTRRGLLMRVSRRGEHTPY
eukprot:TRINITY_DN15975_c0_g3_i1.p1 TRINITY_DN15975_c0_g3~~TRINITY_DN15975_c0_g3_i1.p1  ORF type:complete len:618 (+),score=97.82 TRINITY_DN15975_c0_g3_i1:75-1928(+)